MFVAVYLIVPDSLCKNLKFHFTIYHMKTRKTLDDVISENLQYYRNQTHLTQADLAEKLEVSTSHIANIERKESSVSLSLISRILDLFNITPNDLMLEKTTSLSLTREQKLKALISEKLDTVKYELYSELTILNEEEPSTVFYSSKAKPRTPSHYIADSQKK